MKYTYDDIEFNAVDIDGNPIKRTPFTHPYNYDEFVVCKSDNFSKSDDAVYSDRLLQWDRDAFGNAMAKVRADKSTGQMFYNMSLEEINEFLNIYFGDKLNVEVTAVLQGCNVSNGNPYWVFYYKTVK